MTSVSTLEKDRNLRAALLVIYGAFARTPQSALDIIVAAPADQLSAALDPESNILIPKFRLALVAAVAMNLDVFDEQGFFSKLAKPERAVLLGRISPWLQQEWTLRGLDRSRIAPPGLHEILDVSGRNAHLEALASMGTDRLLQAVGDRHTGAIRMITLIYANNTNPRIDPKVIQAARLAAANLRL